MLDCETRLKRLEESSDDDAEIVKSLTLLEQLQERSRAARAAREAKQIAHERLVSEEVAGLSGGRKFDAAAFEKSRQAAAAAASMQEIIERALAERESLHRKIEAECQERFAAALAPVKGEIAQLLADRLQALGEADALMARAHALYERRLSGGGRFLHFAGGCTMRPGFVANWRAKLVEAGWLPTRAATTN